jgi:hypothetical protein
MMGKADAIVTVPLGNISRDQRFVIYGILSRKLSVSILGSRESV